MNNEFWAAVVGAVIGALAGGGVTWSLQHFQGKADKAERDKGLARSLIFKLMRISTDLDGFRKHVAECEERATETKLAVGWQSLRAIANGPDKVAFTSDEMGYLLGLGDFSLFNRVLSLDAIHASSVDIFSLYANRRLELTNMLPAQMNGMVGEVALNDNAYAVVAPRMAELDDLYQLVRPLTHDGDSQEPESLNL
ncbi:hypothetical protein SZ64_09325 [Erythrobacter sp. SG61-1L]|uniref:hypothetical protein n=1 Tax=Erythrobacter sp. SG61-1L TaxID=1603897 RepID=UPI0006C8E9C8|nr:hypothetical protein [Erythrobacter sp. SG61-1L]KPL68301.1 hypothetical protein SZ64_09325 [Erythrobacter sp. SG61-1L]